MPRRKKLLLIAAALALAGCPKPQYPECKTDPDCADHAEVCINGFCKQCRDDSYCRGDKPLCKDAICVARPVAAPPEPPKPADETCNADADCSEGKACVDGHCKAPPAPAGVSEKIGDCEVKAVYFGFDEATLDRDARRQLDDDFTCLQNAQFRRLRLEGHTDERGTTEYNLALGERRADAVKKYLSGLGLESRKLKAISYGKERPSDPGHDEAAWARNRRVEIATEQ